MKRIASFHFKDATTIGLGGPCKVELLATEVTAIKVWTQAHSCECMVRDMSKWEEPNFLMEAFSLHLHPTGLGLEVIVQCACGQELNATDYDSF